MGFEAFDNAKISALVQTKGLENLNGTPLMADLHILRAHQLGLTEARKIARQWVEQAEQQFGLMCTYQTGQAADEVLFKRAGIQGCLSVTQDKFELNARLGFLLSAFLTKIESEVTRNLDSLLKPDSRT